MDNMDSIKQAEIYLNLTKTSKPTGSAIIDYLTFESVESLRNSLKEIVAAARMVDSKEITISEMIFYPGKKAVAISKTADVFLAKVQKDCKIGVKFGKLIYCNPSESLSSLRYSVYSECEV